MISRYLLDTHILIWWLSEPKKLSRHQARVLRKSMGRSEPVGVSAITLVEIAVLLSSGRRRVRGDVGELLGEIGENPIFSILPLTTEIAAEVAALGPALRDPADRTIIATARVHRLKLLTADQRMIDSMLAAVVE